MSISDQGVQRISLLVEGNKSRLAANFHTETDLVEGCVPVGM